MLSGVANFGNGPLIGESDEASIKFTLSECSNARSDVWNAKLH